MPIDTSLMSAHVINDRQSRIDFIEKTTGWGEPVVIAQDIKGRDATATLTTTGVIVIRDPQNMIITAWVASERQAVSVYRRATGNKKMPNNLFWRVQYNNNTEMWKKRIAA